MKKLRNVPVTFLLGVVLLGTSCQFREPGENVDVLRVTSNIVCNCDCPPTLVRACSCQRAEEMTAEVRGLLAEGKTDEEIYAHYVAQFGAQILAAPKAQGFNLLGWIFPYIVALSGGAIVAAVYHGLKRKKTAQPVGTAHTLEPEAAEKYRKMLARELAE